MGKRISRIKKQQKISNIFSKKQETSHDPQKVLKNKTINQKIPQKNLIFQHLSQSVLLDLNEVLIVYIERAALWVFDAFRYEPTEEGAPFQDFCDRQPQDAFHVELRDLGVGEPRRVYLPGQRAPGQTERTQRVQRLVHGLENHAHVDLLQLVVLGVGGVLRILETNGSSRGGRVERGG